MMATVDTHTTQRRNNGRDGRARPTGDGPGQDSHSLRRIGHLIRRSVPPARFGPYLRSPTRAPNHPFLSEVVYSVLIAAGMSALKGSQLEPEQGCNFGTALARGSGEAGWCGPAAAKTLNEATTACDTFCSTLKTEDACVNNRLQQYNGACYENAACYETDACYENDACLYNDACTWRGGRYEAPTFDGFRPTCSMDSGVACGTRQCTGSYECCWRPATGAYALYPDMAGCTDAAALLFWLGQLTTVFTGVPTTFAFVIFQQSCPG